MTYECPLHPYESLQSFGEYDLDSVEHSNDFFRSLKISSDGKQFHGMTEDNDLLVFDLSDPILSSLSYYSVESDQPIAPSQYHLSPINTIHFGESVYDTTYLRNNDNSTNKLFATLRDHPIHLIDSISGKYLSSYSGYNHLDELEASVSLSLNCQGTKLYAGSERKIRCFDIERPGRECDMFYTSKTRKSMFGQKGLISTINFNPDYSGCYAAGSYSGSVGIYTENSHESVLDITDLGFGVNYVKWSPCGNFLWISGRNSNEISCWDIRNTKQQIISFERTNNTNQRMSFDIDPWGKYLCTGNQQGELLFYDLSTFERVQVTQSKYLSNLNSVIFHPYYAMIISSSGQRHFTLPNDSIASDETDSESENYDLSHSLLKKRKLFDEKGNTLSTIPSSGVTIWSIPHSKLSYPTQQISSEETVASEIMVESNSSENSLVNINSENNIES